MMKKIAACLLSAVLAAGVLAGCGGSSSASSSSSSSTTEAKPAESTSTETASSGDATWPTGAVTILVGFGAGGSSDLGVRALCTYLEKVTGGTFVVSNVTGANGWMAWDQLLHSDADGNTLALVNTPTLFYDYMDPAQQHKETMDDFDFICNEVMDYGVLITKKGAYADMNAFMEAAKAEGGLTVADVGANGNKHLATVQLGMMNPDVTLTPVHQSGYSDNTAALLGGTVDAVSAVYGDIAATLADGEFDVLCVFNNERIDVLPDVPTCEEAGFGAVYEQVTRGYMMPKGVDPAMKEAIVAAFKEAIADEDHLKDLENLGLIEAYMDGDEYINFLKGQEADVEALAPELGWK